MLIVGALLPNQSYDWIQPFLTLFAFVFLFHILLNRKEIMDEIAKNGQNDDDIACVKIPCGKRGRIRRGESAIDTVMKAQSAQYSGNHYKNESTVMINTTTT